MDYFDTYSFISRITSIQILIAILAIKNHEIHQIDVKIAFLNGDLEDEVYMEQPEGFIIDQQDRQENKIFKLVKSLYNLKKNI